VRAVRTYLDHLGVERGLADNTMRSYRRDLRRYLAFLDAQGISTLEEIGEATITAFLMHLREGDGEHCRSAPPRRAARSSPYEGSTGSRSATV
jgi:integrase/recombinase XerD